MATYTEFTVRSGGSNLAAGTLDGVNEAATGSPLYSATNGGWNSGTGVFTPASGDPQGAGVTAGMFASVYTDGSSGPTGFVGRITGVSTTTITVSTTAKSGTAPTTAASGISIIVGGAWAGPSGASGFPIGFITETLTNASTNYPRVNFKNDQTYSVTAAMAAASGSDYITYRGYSSTFGDGGKCVFDGGTSGASYALLSSASGTANGNVFADMEIRNNGATGSANGFTINGTGTVAYRVVVHDVRGNGFSVNGDSALLEECEAYAANQNNSASNAGIRFSSSGTAIRCISHDNSGSNSNGFTVGQGSVPASLIDCIADTNGASGFLLSLNTSASVTLTGCVAYGSTGSGVLASGSPSTVVIQSSIFSNNGGYGISVTGAVARTAITNCAFLSNTSGPVNATANTTETGSVSLSGDPFTAASTGNFTLNNTSGAGAACRNAGIGAFTQTQSGYTGTISYPSIGATEPTPGGGGGGLAISVAGKVVA